MLKVLTGDLFSFAYLTTTTQLMEGRCIWNRYSCKTEEESLLCIYMFRGTKGTAGQRAIYAREHLANSQVGVVAIITQSYNTEAGGGAAIREDGVVVQGIEVDAA